MDARTSVRSATALHLLDRANFGPDCGRTTRVRMRAAQLAVVVAHDPTVNGWGTR